MKTYLLVLCLLIVPACASNPPAQSPATQAIVTATQVIKALDIVRDTAVDLNAQNPPVLSQSTTLKIVNWHESAVKVILATPNGWKATVQASLGQLQTDLSLSDWQRIAPYVTLVQTILAAVN